MALGYKDFFPEVLKAGIFMTEHELLPATVGRAGQWIVESGVQVINVETVVLPNIGKVDETSTVRLHSSGDTATYWYQVVRVWHLSA